MKIVLRTVIIRLVHQELLLVHSDVDYLVYMVDTILRVLDVLMIRLQMVNDLLFLELIK